MCIKSICTEIITASQKNVATPPTEGLAKKICGATGLQRENPWFPWSQCLTLMAIIVGQPRQRKGRWQSDAPELNCSWEATLIWNKKWCVSTCWCVSWVFRFVPGVPLPTYPWLWLGIESWALLERSLIGEIGRAIWCRIFRASWSLLKHVSGRNPSCQNSKSCFLHWDSSKSLSPSLWEVKGEIRLLAHLLCCIVSSWICEPNATNLPPIYHQYLWSQQFYHFAGANILQVEIWLLYDVLCPATLMSSGHCLDHPHRIGFLPIWPLSYHPLPSLWALHGTTELY